MSSQWCLAMAATLVEVNAPVLVSWEDDISGAPDKIDAGDLAAFHLMLLLVVFFVKNAILSSRWGLSAWMSAVQVDMLAYWAKWANGLRG